MIAYESNNTSVLSIDISNHKNADSQLNEITEDTTVNPTMDVEVVPVRRSARERKQNHFLATLGYIGLLII